MLVVLNNIWLTSTYIKFGPQNFIFDFGLNQNIESQRIPDNCFYSLYFALMYWLKPIYGLVLHENRRFFRAQFILQWSKYTNHYVNQLTSKRKNCRLKRLHLQQLGMKTFEGQAKGLRDYLKSKTNVLFNKQSIFLLLNLPIESDYRREPDRFPKMAEVGRSQPN